MEWTACFTVKLNNLEKQSEISENKLWCSYLKGMPEQLYMEYFVCGINELPVNMQQ